MSPTIEHVNEYPTMNYFGNPEHTQSMISYKILIEYFWKFQSKIALWEKNQNSNSSMWSKKNAVLSGFEEFVRL